ncbi:MAG TPA: hypothetical protein VIO57_14825 [Chloroflexota bacterium]
MNLYVALLLLWLVVIPVIVLGCAGLWSVCADGWQHHQTNKLWDDFDKTGASAGTRTSSVGRDGRPGNGDAGPGNPPPFDWAA